MDFDSLPADGQTTAPVKPGAAPAFDSLPDDHETYGTTGQQLLTGVEGAAKGLAGPLATGAEELLSLAGVPGISATDRRGREEANPITHGLTEAGGFVGGLFTGASEASLLGHAGEAANAALKLGGEGASIGSRLASGAAKAATEMGLYQAGDEASKVINQDPNQTVASAIYDVGLSAALGGVTGGTLSGLGVAAKHVVDNSFLKEFSDRLAFRHANLNPNELLQKEFEDAHAAYNEMGSEVGGSNGVGAQARSKLMPAMSPKIAQTTQDITTALDSHIERLGDDPLAKRLRGFADQWKAAITHTPEPGAVTLPETVSPDYSGIPATVLKAKKPLPERVAQMAEAGSDAASSNLETMNRAGFNPYDYGKPAPQLAAPDEIFRATDTLKKQLQAESKFNQELTPLAEKNYRNAAKMISHDLRVSLENPETWGKVGDLQKSLNGAWAEALPAMKDAESKFMTKIEGTPVMDAAKFSTYTNQAGKATSETIRQKMMGNFVDAVEKFHAATADAYSKAGIENPFQPVGMGALKESLNRPSIASRLADTWYDKLGPKAVGEGASAAIGYGVGQAVLPGFGGLGGAYAAKELLGPAFGSIAKGILEKTANAKAYHQALAFGKAAISGERLLDKSAANVFISGVKTLPSHIIPDAKSVEKLDGRLQLVAKNPASMLNVAGDVGHYMPDHAAAFAATTMGAVNALNSQRPKPVQYSPLDTPIPPSKEQKAAFNRTLSIAQQPLSIMQHIKDGTLLPSDVQTLAAISPAAYKQMSQKLMGAMTDHISKGESIPYKTRQSLSLFLGQALDSTMTPIGIQTLQSVFAQKRANQAAQADSSPSKSTQKLGKLANSLQTPDQGRAARANKS